MQTFFFLGCIFGLKILEIKTIYAKTMQNRLSLNAKYYCFQKVAGKKTTCRLIFQKFKVGFYTVYNFFLQKNDKNCDI